MNRDQFEGKWRECKGKIKQKWGKLTDNDIAQINGKYDQFMGTLQKKYGYQRDQAEREFNNWNWGQGSHSQQQGSKQQPMQPEGRGHSENKEYQEGGHRHESNFNRESNRGMKNQDTHKGQNGAANPWKQKEQHPRNEEKKRKAG